MSHTGRTILSAQAVQQIYFSSGSLFYLALANNKLACVCPKLAFWKGHKHLDKTLFSRSKHECWHARISKGKRRAYAHLSPCICLESKLPFKRASWIACSEMKHVSVSIDSYVISCCSIKRNVVSIFIFSYTINVPSKVDEVWA